MNVSSSSSPSTLAKGPCPAPRSLNPAATLSKRACSSHVLRSSSLLLCFWDCGDIFKVPDLCLETLSVCPHLPASNNKHAHGGGRNTHSSPGAGPRALIYLREAGSWHGAHTLVGSVLRLPMRLF